MITFEIIYFFWCIVFAAINESWIKNHFTVLHGLNGPAHLITAAAAWIFFHYWTVPIIFLCIARLVFNTALNKFRGLSIIYVSPNPKSILDKYEKKVFGNNGLPPVIIYSLILIICQALYFKYA